MTEAEQPTQSPEDVMKRMAGIPKTPEELEAEREAMEKERLEKGKVPAPTPPQPGPTEPDPNDEETEPTTTP